MVTFDPEMSINPVPADGALAGIRIVEFPCPIRTIGEVPAGIETGVIFQVPEGIKIVPPPLATAWLMAFWSALGPLPKFVITKVVGVAAAIKDCARIK
jgi:hypothetical protein